MDIPACLATPRISPAEPGEWDKAVTELLGRRRPEEFGEDGRPVFNIFKTLARYPALMKRLAPWGNHVLFKSSLPPRDREILILRAGWLCQALYEWTHHVEIGCETAGLSLDDIGMIKLGPRSPGISSDDAALLTAADELVGDKFLSQQTWDALSRRFSDQQLMDLVFTVGHYTMMCMALNAFGVQLEQAYLADS